jgi:hypothetical protein
LIKYRQHLTKRPGRCNVFECEFKIEGDMPPTANSLPIPFALRAPVRQQIQPMLRDGILEESYSANVSPLTLARREQEPIRICVGARRISRWYRIASSYGLCANCYRDFMDQVT